jgi:hypothetical protein
MGKLFKTAVDAVPIGDTEAAIALQVHQAAFQLIGGRMYEIVVQVRGSTLTPRGVAVELRKLADAIDEAAT